MANEEIQRLVDKARAAQKVIERYDQEKTDKIVRMFAKVVFDNAEPLARMAVEETRMGVFDISQEEPGQIGIIWHGSRAKKAWRAALHRGRGHR